MSIFLWVLQGALALHTAMGAVWRVTNTEQSVPALSAIPHSLWLALIGMDLLCALGLVLPAVAKSLGILAPIAATLIAAEMLLFCGVALASGQSWPGGLTYWLIVAGVCSLIAYGRFVLRPL